MQGLPPESPPVAGLEVADAELDSLTIGKVLICSGPGESRLAVEERRRCVERESRTRDRVIDADDVTSTHRLHPHLGGTDDDAPQQRGSDPRCVEQLGTL